MARITKTKTISVLSLLIAAIVCGAGYYYYFYQGVSAPSSHDKTPHSIAVSQTPLSAPFLVAQEMGLFKKNGINVDIKPCFGGVACAKLLFTGDADYATASESVVMFNAFEHNNFSVLTSFVESDNDLRLLTINGNKITSIFDLIGKKVGVVKASASEFYFDSLLRVNNIPPDNVEKVYLPPESLIPSLLGFKIDAMSAWEPYGYELDMQVGPKVIDLGISGIYQLSFNLLTLNEHLADNAFNDGLLRSLREAILWINSNPDSAQNLLATKLDLPKAQLQWSWHNYVFRLSMGNSLLSNLQLQSRWALNGQLVSGKQPDFRTILANDALNRVLHEHGGDK